MKYAEMDKARLSEFERPQPSYYWMHARIATTCTAEIPRITTGVYWQRRLLVRIALAVLVAIAGLHAEVTVRGRAVDENEAAVVGARVIASAASGEWRAVSDATGGFAIQVPSEGEYLLRAECAGYFSVKDFPVQARAGMSEIVVVLNHAKEVLEKVDVSASPSPIDVERTESERRLSGVQIMDVPYPSTHSMKNALSLTPGVIQDAAGSLHFDGGNENQTNYLLDGFNVGDPLTGTLNTRVSVESIDSMDYLSGRYSPEFGKGSSGTLQIKTVDGDNQLRYSATNFVPGIDTKKGLDLGAWTPRGNLSGPIVKDRAWFSDSFDADYSINIIPDLPSGQDRLTTLQTSNLLHTQFNITPANILFGDFLINTDRTDLAGLNALSPISTTTNTQDRTLFFGFKDQIYLAHGTLLELGFGQERTSLRQVPQGTAPYVITPNGNSGNYFVNATQDSRRDQYLVNLYLPSFQAAGSHQLKAGIDVDRLAYSQDFRRTSYEDIGVAGNVLRTVTFGGSGAFSRPSLEASWYLLDHWRARRNLVFELGVRQDWDELIRRFSLSPRASFSYAPFGSQNTHISGGYAVVYDPTILSLFTQALDQYSLTTTATAANVPSFYTIPNAHLKAPRFQNWSLGLEHMFPRKVHADLSLLRKRGGDGFTYVSTLSTPARNVFSLTNARHDQYDAAQIVVRQPLGGRYEWMASYTRSRAESNAVIDQSVNQPVVVANNTGPLPFDAPNRFLSWGYLPTPFQKWAVAYLVEARNGFPFSIQHETGQLIGAPDSLRYPAYFNVNLHVEWRFRFRGYRLAIRGGFNNLTDHKNPTVVNNTVESPQYLTFLGSEGRHFVVRLRWLGRD